MNSFEEFLTRSLFEAYGDSDEPIRGREKKLPRQHARSRASDSPLVGGKWDEKAAKRDRIKNVLPPVPKVKVTDKPPFGALRKTVKRVRTHYQDVMDDPNASQEERDEAQRWTDRGPGWREKRSRQDEISAPFFRKESKIKNRKP